MTEHDKLKEIALITSGLQSSASAMLRRSRYAAEDGDLAGSARESCIAIREYEWAAVLWAAIGFEDLAVSCREKADAIRAGDTLRRVGGGE